MWSRRQNVGHVQSSWTNLTELLTPVWPSICKWKPQGYNFQLVSLKLHVNHLNRKLSYKMHILLLMGCRLMTFSYSQGITKLIAAVSFLPLNCTSEGFSTSQVPISKRKNRRLASSVRPAHDTRQWVWFSNSNSVYWVREPADEEGADIYSYLHTHAYMRVCVSYDCHHKQESFS